MDKYDQTIALWNSYKITTAQDLDRYLDNFRILFSYHSGKMENEEVIYQTTRGIFENNMVVNFTGDPKTLFEQYNQKVCYEIFKPKIIAKEPLSLELIKGTHAILTSGIFDINRFLATGERPGEFKKFNYMIGLEDVGSAADFVEEEMSELIDEMNYFKGTNILKAATYFHARFQYSHPFADGNGLVGRALTNYYLLINDFPPMAIFADEKEKYYECLRAYDAKEDLDLLYKFFKTQIVRTWEKSLGVSQGRTKGHKILEDYQ